MKKSASKKPAPPGDRELEPLKEIFSELRAFEEAVDLSALDTMEAMRLSGITPHDLRRTAGSWAVQGGAPMAIVSAALGHADQRVTQQHYGHLDDKDVRNLMNSNAALLMAGMPEGSIEAMLTAGQTTPAAPGLAKIREVME